MSAILDVVAALRLLLEPTDAVAIDESSAEPLARDVDTLYVYPNGRLAEVPFETGPTARQDFGITAVFATASSESALRLRDEDVSQALDDKLGQYLATVRQNRVTTRWHHIQADVRPAPASLTSRAIALDITGYRFV